MKYETEQPMRRDWSQDARRWWPAGAIVAALIATAYVVGRGERDNLAAETTEVHADEDSVVTLDSTALRLANVELLAPAATGGGALIANGTITFDANHVSAISSRVEGRVLAVQKDLGQQVAEGEVLALLESSEVGQTRGDLERARAAVDIARRNHEREKRLFEQSITPQKELLEAESAFRLAEADFNSAASRLRAIGADVGEGAGFGLATPISGTVVERNASPGQVVGPATNLFTVANLRHVWITVDVYEADLSRVRQGAAASVTPAALPDQSFSGKVTYAGGVVDPTSRTFKVRVQLENAALRLRPGMFAQVHIAAVPVSGGDASGPLMIPETAVQEINGQQVVFVAVGVPGRFVARRVTLGPRSAGGLVAVTNGLTGSDRIVGRGAFQLKSEMLKASFGESH